MSALVLAAYSMPSMARCDLGIYIYGPNATLTTFDAFSCTHSMLMYVSIPPVVCVTLMVYSFMWLVLALHNDDFHKLSNFIEQQVGAFQERVLRAAVANGDIDVDLSGFGSGSGLGSGRPTPVRMLRDRISLRTRTNVSLYHALHASAALGAGSADAASTEGDQDADACSAW